MRVVFEPETAPELPDAGGCRCQEVAHAPPVARLMKRDYSLASSPFAVVHSRTRHVTANVQQLNHVVDKRDASHVTL